MKISQLLVQKTIMSQYQELNYEDIINILIGAGFLGSGGGGSFVEGRSFIELLYELHNLDEEIKESLEIKNRPFKIYLKDVSQIKSGEWGAVVAGIGKPSNEDNDFQTPFSATIPSFKNKKEYLAFLKKLDIENEISRIINREKLNLKDILNTLRVSDQEKFNKIIELIKKKIHSLYDAIDKVVDSLESSLISSSKKLNNGKLDHIFIAEAGVANVILAMITAARRGIPIINGDGAGRAVPTLDLTTFALQGISIDPASLVSIPDSKSETPIELKFTVKEPLLLDKLIRNIIDVDEFGGDGIIATFAMNGETVHEKRPVIVPRTIDKMMNFGEVFTSIYQEESNSKFSQNLVEKLNSEGEEVFLLYKGYYKEQRIIQREGFDAGIVVFGKNTKPDNDDFHDEVHCIYLNENLMLWSREKTFPIAMAPDLICYLDEKGLPITNADDLEEEYKDQEISIIGISSSDLIKKPTIVERFSRLSGHLGSYLSLSDLNNHHKENNTPIADTDNLVPDINNRVPDTETPVPHTENRVHKPNIQKSEEVYEFDAHHNYPFQVLNYEEFLKESKNDEISIQSCILIIEQAILFISELYVNLSFKSKLYGFDIVQKLKVWLQSFDNNSIESVPALEFHFEMMEIFNLMRDRHLAYKLPSKYERKVACLPFIIEKYYLRDDNNTPQEEKYIISKVIRSDNYFDELIGSEIISFNGMSIDQAIDINSRKLSGSNDYSQKALGLELLTVRPLRLTFFPEESYIYVKVKTLTGKICNIKFEWKIIQLPEEGNINRLLQDVGDAFEGLESASNDIPLSIYEVESNIKSSHKELFKHKDKINSPQIQQVSFDREEFDSIYDNLKCEIIRENEKKYIYIRIYNFNVESGSDNFVNEFARLITHTPSSGLIIDIRDNPGGFLAAAEGILQLLTPASINPQTAKILASKINKKLVNVDFYHTYPFKSIIDQSYEIGQKLTSDVNPTNIYYANNIGQKYYHPVILINNSISYSAATIFSAGFKDHNVGKIIGTDSLSGAGGAVRLRHQDIISRLQLNDAFLRETGFKPLVNGVDITLAHWLMVRVNKARGEYLEFSSVEADINYHPTYQDLISRNEDLILFAIQKLQVQEVIYTLDIISIDLDIKSSQTIKLTLDLKFSNLTYISIASESVNLTKTESVNLSKFVKLDNSGNQKLTIDYPDHKFDYLRIYGYDNKYRLKAAKKTNIRQAYKNISFK